MPREPESPEAKVIESSERTSGTDVTTNGGGNEEDSPDNYGNEDGPDILDGKGDDMPEAKNERYLRRHCSRLEKSIYGLIIIASGNGELHRQSSDMPTAMKVIGGGSLVLVVSHVYSSYIATLATTNKPVPCRNLIEDLIDQLSIAIPATAAVLIYLVSYLGAYSTNVAYRLVFAVAIVALFSTGYAIGYHRHQVICGGDLDWVSAT